MTGTHLGRGHGKARGSYLQLLIALTLAAVMIVAAGCSPKEPEPVTGGGTGPKVSDAKNGEDAKTGDMAPAPGGENAEDRVGTKTGGN